MARKYKMPRIYKSPETYQRFIDGTHNGGKVPKNITPEIREKLKLGGVHSGITRRKKSLDITKE